MHEYIVFRPGYQFIIEAETMIRAIQSAILHSGGFAREWTAHRLDTYPAHLQIRLQRESAHIGA